MVPSNASLLKSISNNKHSPTPPLSINVTYGLSMEDQPKQLPLSFFYFTNDIEQAHIITAMELQTTTPKSTCVNCNFVEVMEKSAELRGKCPQCFDCPRCNAVLTHMENENRIVYFSCQNCKWSSFQLNWMDTTLEGLLEKQFKREDKKLTHVQSLVSFYKQDSQSLKTESELTAALKAEKSVFKKSILIELHNNAKKFNAKSGLDERRFATMDDVLLSIDKQYEMKYSASFDYHKLISFDQLNSQPNESNLLQERWPKRKHLIPFYCKHYNKKLIVKYGEVGHMDPLQFSRNWNASWFLPSIKVVEIYQDAIFLSFWNPRRNGLECEIEIVKEDGIDIQFDGVGLKKCKVMIPSEILSALSTSVKQETPLVVKTAVCSATLKLPCQRSEKFSFAFHCKVSEWSHTNLVKFKNSQEYFVFVGG